MAEIIRDDVVNICCTRTHAKCRRRLSDRNFIDIESTIRSGVRRTNVLTKTLTRLELKRNDNK